MGCLDFLIFWNISIVHTVFDSDLYMAKRWPFDGVIQQADRVYPVCHEATG